LNRCGTEFVPPRKSLNLVAALFHVAITLRLIAARLLAILLIISGLIAALLPVFLLAYRIPGAAWLLALSGSSTLLLIALHIALLLVALLIVHSAS
jgi:hypothetical protein